MLDEGKQQLPLGSTKNQLQCCLQNKEMKKDNTTYYIRRSLIVILLFVSFSSIHAQQVVVPRGGPAGSWHLLGTVTANHTADHGQIIVAGPHDYFRRLKFKVTNSPLIIKRMIVRYDDGGAPENIDIRYNIPNGGESREIDLRGGKRKLKAVDFWYETKGFLNGKAHLTLFGIK